MIDSNIADTLLRRKAGQACLSKLGIPLCPCGIGTLGRFFIVLQASCFSFSHSGDFRLPSYKLRSSTSLYLIVTSFYFLWQSQPCRCRLIIQPLSPWHGGVHRSQTETAIAEAITRDFCPLVYLHRPPILSHCYTHLPTSRHQSKIL